MSESLNHNMIISSDKVVDLSEDEKKVVAFNFIEALSRILGERAVHRAIRVFLGVNGYDVYKF